MRAARALLAWSQQDLAKAAGVATSTVADFERGQRTPVANNAQAIRGALESAGIRFLPTGAVIGPAVPIITAVRSPWRAGPMGQRRGSVRLGEPHRRCRQSADAARPPNSRHPWAGRPTPLSLPTKGFGIPAGMGSPRRDIGSAYVPQGDAGWEIGAQRSNIVQKATDDYRKRTAEPAPLDPGHAPPMSSSPRATGRRRTNGPRRARTKGPGVRSASTTPTTSSTGSSRRRPSASGSRPAWASVRPGPRELDEVWEEWSLATQWPLTEDLVLSDRDQDAAEVLRWLRGEPSVLSLQATTTDEVVAFFHATLSELPDDLAAAYRARCLVATTAAAARALANAPAPLILLLTEPEPGLARSLAERGHYVLQAYDERPVSRGEVRTLARPSREGIASALTAAGIAEPRAKALARDSARNLAVLRRLIPGAPGRLPKWAEEPPPHALLAALLAGGWDENAEADRARLVGARRSALRSRHRRPGSLRRRSSTARCRRSARPGAIASPSDAWFLLAHHLTSGDITRFEAAAHAVLGSADPRFDMDPDERWMAGVRGDPPRLLGHAAPRDRSGPHPARAVGRSGPHRSRRRRAAPTPSSASCCGTPISGGGGRSLATSGCWPRRRRTPS